MLEHGYGLALDTVPKNKNARITVRLVVGNEEMLGYYREHFKKKIV